MIYFTTKLRNKLLEPNSASFTGMSFVIPKTPALETFIYVKFLLKRKNQRNCKLHTMHVRTRYFISSFRTTSLYICVIMTLILANFLSFRFVSVHKRAKGVRRIFSRLDRPSLVSKIKKIFSCWTKRTTFKITRIAN